MYFFQIIKLSGKRTTVQVFLSTSFKAFKTIQSSKRNIILTHSVHTWTLI